LTPTASSIPAKSLWRIQNSEECNRARNRQPPDIFARD
jgi:hypothetical protein